MQLKCRPSAHGDQRCALIFDNKHQVTLTVTHQGIWQRLPTHRSLPCSCENLLPAAHPIHKDGHWPPRLRLPRVPGPSLDRQTDRPSPDRPWPLPTTVLAPLCRHRAPPSSFALCLYMQDNLCPVEDQGLLSAHFLPLDGLPQAALSWHKVGPCQLSPQCCADSISVQPSSA